MLASAPHSGKSIDRKINYLHKHVTSFFVEWLEEYKKPNFRAISLLIKNLQIYEFTVPGSSGTTGTAIPKSNKKNSKSEVPKTTHQVLF
jgi:hypothetical protein